jgi:hypothetical protein
MLNKFLQKIGFDKSLRTQKPNAQQDSPSTLASQTKLPVFDVASHLATIEDMPFLD